MHVLIAQIDQAQQILDHASQQSDRWIALAILCILFAFAWIVIKNLSNQLDKERSVHSDDIKTVIKESIVLTAKVTVVMEENNDVIRKNTEMMSRIDNKMSR